ncbi:MAG: hypothetical protein QOD51_2602, partial [Candidatus Eremiobacteraeota bacterium]|nr:hypothetical protein [Candidatus Eremiobacteraeota bacterium]
NAKLEGRKAKKTFTTGAAAADHVVTVMRDTLQRLPPQEIIDAFTQNTGRSRLPEMWNALGDRTIDCIVEGAVGVAEYWESAWLEGRSDAGAVALDPAPRDMDAASLAQDDHDLMALYRDKSFMQSRLLGQMRLP